MKHSHQRKWIMNSDVSRGNSILSRRWKTEWRNFGFVTWLGVQAYSKGCEIFCFISCCVWASFRTFKIPKEIHKSDMFQKMDGDCCVSILLSAWNYQSIDVSSVSSTPCCQPWNNHHCKCYPNIILLKLKSAWYHPPDVEVNLISSIWSWCQPDIIHLKLMSV